MAAEESEDTPITMCLYVRKRATAIEVVNDFLAAGYPKVCIEPHRAGGYVVYRPQDTLP